MLQSVDNPISERGQKFFGSSAFLKILEYEGIASKLSARWGTFLFHQRNEIPILRLSRRLGITVQSSALIPSPPHERRRSVLISVRARAAGQGLAVFVVPS
jgi:hypothetical protein